LRRFPLSGQIPYLYACAEIKVFWFFSSEKNILRLSKLLLEIDFRAGGNSFAHMREGWAEQERTHRWTLGRESRLVLPAVGPGCVLAICATPCRHPPDLPGQAVMLALGEKLLGAPSFSELGTFAYRLPVLRRETVLRILHLNEAAPRGAEQYRHGEPLGLMVHSIRLFGPAGQIPRPAAFSDPAMSDEALALRFESIGQACHFGLIQREMGAEPISLLRFVDTTTSHLVDGLVAGFAAVDRPGRLHLAHTVSKRPTYRWHQQDYNLHFDTRIHVGEAETEAVNEGQLRRLSFLRGKFLDDVRAGEKIYVLTRSDCLTEPEALAVFCALNAHAPATLLWTVFGNLGAAGRVDEVSPGFLCGHLGVVDEERYAPVEVWRRVMQAC
jgi:hypothetical protein